MENNILECIKARRSVRRFQNKAVGPDTMSCLLRAAMRAPSAHNQQPWEFIVVQNKELIESFPQYLPDYRACSTAPAAVLFCANSGRLTCPNHWIQDLSASVSLFLLEAVHQKLGAVWMGVAPDWERMRYFSERLDVPPEFYPFALVAIGYPSTENDTAVDRYKPERIRYID